MKLAFGARSRRNIFNIPKKKLGNKEFLTFNSFTMEIEAGVPQGSVLALKLYNIYTSDIIKTDRTIMFLYADDPAITATSLNTNMVTWRKVANSDICGVK